MTARPGQPADAAAIARIYNQGIEDRIATFETRLRTSEDIGAWFDSTHPIVVVESDGSIIAFAATFTYRPRDCYNGVAEFSVYVDRRYRGRSAGRTAMLTLIDQPLPRDSGSWYLAFFRKTKPASNF